MRHDLGNRLFHHQELQTVIFDRKNFLFSAGIIAGDFRSVFIFFSVNDGCDIGAGFFRMLQDPGAGKNAFDRLVVLVGSDNNGLT